MSDRRPWQISKPALQVIVGDVLDVDNGDNSGPWTVQTINRTSTGDYEFYCTPSERAMNATFTFAPDELVELFS